MIAALTTLAKRIRSGRGRRPVGDFFRGCWRTRAQKHRPAVASVPRTIRSPRGDLRPALAVPSRPSIAASPHGLGGICYSRRRTRGWATDRAQEIAEAERLARRAVELGRDDAVALYTGGFTLAHLVGDVDVGTDLINAALAIDPNSASGWYYGGWVKFMLCEPEQAIAYQVRSMRLSPIDPLRGLMRTATGFAHLLAGRYKEAISWAQRACLDQPNFPLAWRLLASSSALSGRLDQAQKALARALQLDPGMDMSTVSQKVWRRAEDFERYAKGLRLAGLSK